MIVPADLACDDCLSLCKFRNWAFFSLHFESVSKLTFTADTELESLVNHPPSDRLQYLINDNRTIICK